MNQDMQSDSAKKARKQEAKDANRDPITKKPGSHPVGTGIGTAAGGAAGVAGAVATAVATGTTTGAIMGGPVGAAAGLVAGAVVGAVAGHAIGEKLNPTKEAAYWRNTYQSEPYYTEGYTYDDYDPAYRVGYEGTARYAGKSFSDVERDLEVDYNRAKGKSRLQWEHAKTATRRAWDRVAGDRDNDVSNSR